MRILAIASGFIAVALLLPAPAQAQAQVPAGAYQCQGPGSSRARNRLSELHIGGGGYAAPSLRGSGQYRVDETDNTVLFASGPLAGRTATYGSARNGRTVLRLGETLCTHRRGA